MKEIIKGIVDDVMVRGVQMNEEFSIQDRTVKMGAFCPIAKDIESFYQT